MRRLGDVTSVHGAVAVVACCDEPPDMDDAVYDAGMDRVGTVVDIVGPVEAPYAVVERATTVDAEDRLYLR